MVGFRLPPAFALMHTASCHLDSGDCRNRALNQRGEELRPGGIEAGVVADEISLVGTKQFGFGHWSGDVWNDHDRT
jgi:hypothetical protein